MILFCDYGFYAIFGFLAYKVWLSFPYCTIFFTILEENLDTQAMDQGLDPLGFKGFFYMRRWP